MAHKFRLGKGLDALLPLDDMPSIDDIPSIDDMLPDTELSSPDFSASGMRGLNTDEEIIYMGDDADKAGGRPEDAGRGPARIPLDKLNANPGQPRKNFDEEALKELADSIREHGIIQPILVEEAGDGSYTVIAGERRSRAARMAGLTEVPALIRSYTDEQRMEVSLIENIQRADLNPVEEAMAYRQLMELTGLSQDDVAVRVGKNRATVANTLRLLKLPQPMLQALRDGGLSPGHGRALLSVSDPPARETLFREITGRGISVREAERRAGVLNSPEGGNPVGKPAAGSGGENTVPVRPQRDAELIAIEQQFIDVLGTKVTIDGDLKKGKIHIDYYSMEDLDRLLEILKKPDSGPGAPAGQTGEYPA
ncbi:MAG: ParB/RepB/Spo0J family partition protein [Treponema sp.]|jgi:ParB family chromosome partitioning protein|nr:ParB/RepB/Spo0J family partition protein [Treponema sp.]